MLCLLNLLSYFEEVWCSFFSKCLVGFTSEAINWTQKFFCREFCDSITLFLCDSVLGGFVVLGICPLYLVIPFVGEQVFTVLYNDFLELTSPKYVLFIIGNWNAKVGSQEIPGVTGKFGHGV